MKSTKASKPRTLAPASRSEVLPLSDSLGARLNRNVYYRLIESAEQNERDGQIELGLSADSAAALGLLDQLFQRVGPGGRVVVWAQQTIMVVYENLFQDVQVRSDDRRVGVVLAALLPRLTARSSKLQIENAEY